MYVYKQNHLIRNWNWVASIYHLQMHAGGLANKGEGTNVYIKGSNHIYAILVGIFSAITGGISYCLIRAGAKASDQPM